MKTIRIGSGAGYAGDRIEPAVELAQKGDIHYLVFECLAERTIAIGQKQKQQDPEKGYNELLADRMHAVLPICLEKGIKIITNMGSANPVAAGQRVLEIAKTLGAKRLKIAVVTGDDAHATLITLDARLDEIGKPISACGKDIISANAYLGADALVEALRQGADIIIAGRVSDPSLFLSAMMYEFNWAADDWERLGKGTCIGHLLECAGQITGGYYADPGFKDIPHLARLGFPLAEVTEDGNAVITKVDGSGGRVCVDTCKEQLLYEIHRPDRYITPDVIADFSRVTFTQEGENRVRVAGANGSAKTDTLKVSVGYQDGFIGEGEISYAGPGAVARGRLALEIVKQRFALCQLTPQEVRYDLIGVDSLHGPQRSQQSQPYEVRVRVAARCSARSQAVKIGNEVETLYTNGPAGGGGVNKAVKEILAMDSTLLPRDSVTPAVAYLEIK
ncbi:MULTISPECIES: acyclic terpene utilization AtuA family protein [unclassified Brenneria]|uniref:acyclic terpene utilization AtuA family protein n=1 Tax=unclassified Brenneria TaxID=2634434 RepID=UPI0029C1674D|nr:MULTISPECIES: acyclic terpene utilization AtuA family protein [unclassified Brenneria]MDX5627926.1 acyclic terpene utilization AtuA family protein [Brenneria sp. L3-3Z]MDX5694764.1 acyclic terpene utilization AtuA family protein [Brenneria sp. L4-2C]